MGGVLFPREGGGLCDVINEEIATQWRKDPVGFQLQVHLVLDN